jgi:thiamine-phosphate pyrophosphorylase
MAFVLRGYYAVLNLPGEAPEEPARLLARAEARLAARPACLQLRAKHMGAADLRRIAALLLPACHAAGVPLCVNDRLDVALAAGADGVHLGQNDLPLADALRIRPSRQFFIGISTHDLAQAQAAAREGADYIGFAPVFATQTKTDAGSVVGLDRLREVCAAVSLPVVAIGGITLANVDAVAATGAAAAAVIAAIDQAADPVAAARGVAQAFAIHAPRART